MRHLHSISIWLAMGILSGCASSKPALQSVPQADQSTSIVFFETEGLLRSGVLRARGYGDEAGLNLAHTGTALHGPLVSLDNSEYLRPTSSPTLQYSVAADPSHEFIDFEWGRDVDVVVIDHRNQHVTARFEVAIPKQEYRLERFALPWSTYESAFYAVVDGVLCKLFSNGRKEPLFGVASIHAYAVAPSEKYALCHEESRIVLHSLEIGSTPWEFEVGSTLGIRRKYARAIAWSPDETRVSFAEGWNLYCYDISRDTLLQFKPGGKVFHVEWLSDSTLIFVKGIYPSDHATMDSDRYFEIDKLNLHTGKRTKLHKRINHEPFSVQPRKSPSGSLLLFSEKKLNGPYEIKLMSQDGSAMTKLGKGKYPEWASIRTNGAP